MILSVQDVLDCVRGRVANEQEIGSRLSDIRITQLGPLTGSTPSHLAFFFSRDFEDELPLAKPGILITGEPFVQGLQKSGLPLWNQSVVIACPDPYLGMALLSEKYAVEVSSVVHPIMDEVQETQIHPSAVIAATAKLASGVVIGPHCVIEDGVTIGKNTRLYPGCYVGPKSSIGEHCVLFPRVTLYEWTQVGNRVRIHAGCILGADGFGYAPKKVGKAIERHQKIYHIGKVVIEDDVEIGANTCIDRGTFDDTRVGKKAILDNMTQIGHNVQIAEGAVICGGNALAGNSSIGRFAYIAGICGISNHVHVGDGAQVGAMTLVSKDVPPGEVVVGSPQRGFNEHFRIHALLNKLLEERRGRK